MIREECEKNYQLLEDQMKAFEKEGKSYDYALIRRAFEWCVNAHEGQLRSSGEAYYYHPFHVCKIIISLGMDSQSIAAALLHDVVEDTPIKLEEIEENFGQEVAQIVDGVTKIGRIFFSTKEQQQAESLRKMLVAMAKDIRVIVIKLADRLHNMRTLDAMPEQKRRDVALETMEVYAPIAHRLGIRAVKEELEDRALFYLDPVAYGEIENLLKIKKHEREEIIKEIRTRVEERLGENLSGASVTFQGRVKSINGIYRKMYVQGKDFDEIYDIYAIRIITNTVTDCYNILGIMHDMFRPIPNRFKDYISTPKPNMYQSLHTTVISREGVPFEIQIRTWDMHHTAEFGIAAHWKYKEGITENNTKMEERLAWIRQLIDSQQESEDATDIISTIKVDLAPEDVFAVTPKGDVINLPVGATIVDFAFAIHSAVGIKMVGAKVDGKIVPINHVIETGEIIEILTSNQAGRGPSRDWLKIAVTGQAKSKIRSWFKKEKRPENIVTGKAEFERELKQWGLNISDDLVLELLDSAFKKQKLQNIEDFYAAIGYGGITLSKIMPRLKDEFNKLSKANKTLSVETVVRPKTAKASDGVIVEGIDNCLIKFSKCCTPLPGDEIVGFITRGHGVSIHKRDCNNVPRDLSLAAEPDRWLNAYWASNQRDNFTSSLQIMGVDREGMLLDVTTVIYNLRVPLHAINARQVKNGNCIVNITVSAESVEHLKNIISRLEKIHGVFSVDRTTQ